MCSSCPGPKPLARSPSARGSEEPPSFPRGLAGACGRCLSRSRMKRAGRLSTPSPPWAPVAGGGFTPSPTPPPCSSSSSSSSSSRCCGASVPTLLRALRRDCAPDTQEPGQQRSALSCGRGDRRRRGAARPIQPGSHRLRLRLRLSHCAAAILVSPLTGGAGSPSQRRNGPPASA